jgi:hypothetical protein
MYGLSSFKADLENFLGVAFAIRGCSSKVATGAQGAARWVLDMDLAHMGSACGNSWQGGLNTKEPWVREDVKAMEILFVKMEYGALGGAALRPRGVSFLGIAWPSNLVLVVSLGGRVEDLGNTIIPGW